MANDAQCQYCLSVVQLLVENITSDTTKDQAEELLLSAAENLGSLEAEATKFVKDDAEAIYDFVGQEMDPHTICAALGACAAQ